MSDTSMHPLRVARKNHRNLTQQQLADKTGLTRSTIERAERGEPVSLYTRQKLCEFFDKTAQELGLVNEEVAFEPPQAAQERLPASAASVAWQGAAALLSPRQAIDLLCETSDVRPEQMLGAWLALAASDLAPLFDAGWSLETLLESLHIVLRGVQAMPKVTRRRLFQLGAAAVVGGIIIPSDDHVSQEERSQLCGALGESIAAGWRLFHTASNAQVLAVGQAQLYFVQQASPYLYPSVRPLLYAGVYNLIGASLHFQGYYDEAYQAHERAYVAALEGMNVLNMVQSRSCQANGLREQQRYSEALQTIKAALQLISQQTDTESIRLRAHLFASGAEIAALLGETEVVQRNLAASEALLEHLPLTNTEEFDHASWHQYTGTCALILKQHDKAARELQQAVDTLPPQWLVRHAIALMPLAIAYARGRDRDRCLATVEKAVRVIGEMNAPSFNRQFVGYLEQEILGQFPGDPQISDVVARTRQHLVARPVSSHIN